MNEFLPGTMPKVGDLYYNKERRYDPLSVAIVSPPPEEEDLGGG